MCLVVLSLGVLAIVALQISARRSQLEAAQRALAAQLAYDLAERMRLNSHAQVLPVYRARLGRGARGAEPQPSCSEAAPCGPAQLAAHDLWSWERLLDGASETTAGTASGGLVHPAACVDGPAPGGDGVYVITVAWRGALEMPDVADVDCGRDPQPDGQSLYSKGDADNAFRRTLSLRVYITARRATAP